jgi:serine-type D-Ala-D-Ala carboxypeptidase
MRRVRAGRAEALAGAGALARAEALARAGALAGAEALARAGTAWWRAGGGGGRVPVARVGTMAIALASALLSGCGSAEEERPTGTPGPALASALAFADSVLAECVAQEILPGAVLLVARDGVVLQEKAFGYAKLYEGGLRLETPEPLTVDHLFDLASVTKVMATTWAMMLLVDRGLVELDDPVHTYLPDFRGPEKDRITVRDLLTHRSGLYRWKPVFFHGETPAEAYTYIRDLPLESGVREGRRYSDLGFMLAGYIVGAVSGRPLDVFLREELYRPLGLSRTGFVPARGGTGWPRPAIRGVASRSEPAAGEAAPGFLESRRRRLDGPFAATSHGNPYETRMVEDDSFGYLCDEDPSAFTGWRTHTLQGEVNDGNAWHAHGGVAGHAGLFSTASDLGVLLGVLLNEGMHGDRRVVGPGVVREFMTPDTLTGNGVGWAMGRMGKDRMGAGQGEEGEDRSVGDEARDEGGAFETQVFTHTGFTGTYVMGAPELGLAVVFLSNRQNVGVDEEGYYPDAGRVYMPVVRRIVEAVAREGVPVEGS